MRSNAYGSCLGWAAGVAGPPASLRSAEATDRKPCAALEWPGLEAYIIDGEAKDFS